MKIGDNLKTKLFDEIMTRKVIHRNKNLFCNVLHNCNLVPEFNGLVSKGVNRKIGPFMFN